MNSYYRQYFRHSVIALLFIVYLFSPVKASIPTVEVGKVEDSVAVPSTCTTPTDASLCNLRSAWSLCSTSHILGCRIVLPFSKTIYFNSTLGPLSTSKYQNIEIFGNVSVLSPKFEGDTIPSFIISNETGASFTIRDITFLEFGDRYSSGSLFDVFDAKSLFLEKITILQENSFLISSYSVLSVVNSTDISLLDCNFRSVFYSFALYSANSENITVLNSTCTGASHCYRFEEGSTMIRIDGGVLTENFNTDKTGLITFNLVNDVVFRNVVFIQNANSVASLVTFETLCVGIKMVNCQFNSNDVKSAIVVEKLNSDILFSGCEFIDIKVSKEGNGAVYIGTGNNDITFSHSTFTRNIGGAVYIDSTNRNIVFSSCNFNVNKATLGAAVYGNYLNQYIDFIGCSFTGNFAANPGSSSAGGAIYMGEENTNLAIVDQSTGDNINIVETDHPYSYTALAGEFQTNVSIFVTNAESYLLIFDEDSELADSDTFRVGKDISSESGTAVFKNGFFPGVTEPGFFIKSYGSPLYLGLLRGESSDDSQSGIYFGVKLRVFPIFPSSDSTTYDSKFVLNSADSLGQGGGVLFSYKNQNLVIIRTYFNANKALQGGAIHIGSVNSGMICQDCMFDSNIASQDAGSVYISTANYGVQFIRSSFSNNSAVQEGGAVFLASSNGDGLFDGVKNYVVFDNCILSNNSAVYGGALYSFFENVIIFSSVQFRKNSASLSGGALFFEKDNLVYFWKSALFYNNFAGFNGGALISDYRNKIDFNYNEEDSLLTVERNEAGNMGGGLCILNLTDVTFGPCLFESNVAYTGGAMLVRSTFLYAVTSSSLYNITVSRNRAYRGSGFALGDIYSYGVDGNGVCAYVVIEDGVEVYSQNYNIQFIENKASVAGTIYWLYNPQKPNVPPSLERCTYLYNTAPTGTRYTTQPMAAKIQEEYTVQVYGADLSPEIVITLLDYYNSTVTSDNITAAQAYVSNYSCAGNQGYLSSSTYEVSSSGAIVFDNLRAVCHPDGTLDSNFHVTVNDASYFSLEYLDIYHLVVSSKFVFRDCVAGEILTSGNCQQCKNSSYLLTYDVSKTSCDRCPQEADVCYSNYIYLKTGYWRRSEYTDHIFTCPYGNNACIGGPSYGTDLCAEGYIGPLCAVCDDNYFFVSDYNKCKECTGTNVLTPQLILILVVIFISVSALGYYMYIKYINVIQKQESDLDEKNRPIVNAPKTVLEWFKGRFVSLTFKLKLIVATYQIVESIPYTFQISYPAEFASFFNVFRVFNFNLSQIIPLPCMFEGDYIDGMLVVTLSPIAFTCILYILAFIEFHVRKRYMIGAHATHVLKVQSLFKTLRFRYVSFFLIVTYMILPSITTTIFKIFPCQNLDPENDDSFSSDLYLIADYSIDCNSNRYTFGVTYAIFMIFVYPIGLPLLYFYLLYTHKEEIKNRGVYKLDEDTWLQSLSKLSDDAKVLQFLYRDYKPQYWYFEIIETYRRILLTAVVSVILTGTSEQIVIAIFFTFIIYEACNKAKPFIDKQTSTVSRIGQGTVLFSFFFALMIRGELVTDNAGIAAGLIILNLAIFIVTICFEIKQYYTTFYSRKNSNKRNVSAEDLEIYDPKYHDDDDPISLGMTDLSLELGTDPKDKSKSGGNGTGYFDKITKANSLIASRSAAGTNNILHLNREKSFNNDGGAAATTSTNDIRQSAIEFEDISHD